MTNANFNNSRYDKKRPFGNEGSARKINNEEVQEARKRCKLVGGNRIFKWENKEV